MSWQLALVVMTIANVTTTLIQRHYSQKSTVPATIPSAASYLFGVLPVGITAGLLFFPHEIHWSGWLVALLALCGISMAVSGAVGFYVIRHLSVAANMTIGKTTSILVILMGWVLLGEKLTTWQLVGGAILLAAALLAIWAPAKTDAGAFKRLHPSTVALALLACATLAVGLVTEKAALNHMQIGGIFLVGWTSQTLAMLLLATKDFSRHNFRAFYGREFKWSALMGAVNGTTGVFYVYAIVHSDNISLVTALTAVILPLTVFGAYIFLREREHHKIMWASLAVSLVGLLVSGL